MIVASLSTIIATVLGVPAAWAYSRFPIKAKKDQLFFILSTRFMPPVVVVIPVFLMFRDLSLLDTRQGLILVYAAFNLPFTIWMMKGFIDEVPAEYEEAAMLDGYSRFEAFWRVTMPLLIPGIAATAVFALIFSWNEFVFSIFLITDPASRTAPSAIAGLIGGTDDRLGAGRRLGDGVRHAGAHLRLPGAQAPRGRRHARGGASLMAEVLVSKLHKAFPDGTVAVEELDLEIADGELFVMLGPSGCGKTTTLRCIAGLEQETSGTITIGNEVVSGLRPSQRDIAMVFQFYALYPHLSVRDNMAFPLRAAKAPGVRGQRARHEAARMLQLEPFLTRKPNKLSGGEQQRVALGRAMVRHPKAFLMDEPLTNLDAELRADMRAELKHVQQRLNSTMIYVTHDQTEAMALGHRIAILNKGKLEQLGAPMEVYERPATLFAARFIGSPPMNLIEAELTNGVLTAAGGLTIAAPEGLKRGDRVIAGVRPERFTRRRRGRAARAGASSRARRSATRRSTSSRPRPGCSTCACPRRPASRRSRSCPSATSARRRRRTTPRPSRW